jgi:hypothetical protein
MLTCQSTEDFRPPNVPAKAPRARPNSAETLVPIRLIFRVFGSGSPESEPISLSKSLQSYSPFLEISTLLNPCRSFKLLESRQISASKSFTKTASGVMPARRIVQANQSPPCLIRASQAPPSFRPPWEVEWAALLASKSQSNHIYTN